MHDKQVIQRAISSLKDGIPFGLFEDGRKCVFKDGTQVGYRDLWIALRIVYSLKDQVHNKTIRDLCRNQFEGIFQYNFKKHKWSKVHTAKTLTL